MAKNDHFVLGENRKEKKTIQRVVCQSNQLDRGARTQVNQGRKPNPKKGVLIEIATGTVVPYGQHGRCT